VVTSISAVKKEGAGTGVGAVIGGLVGGLAGNQVGGGDGKKIATVAGVIGGAVVGNKIEGNRNDDSYYVITVDMDDGGQRTATVDNAAALGIGIGSPVTIVGNDISLR
jgi:outer membrane lipoprotein SlyB